MKRHINKIIGSILIWVLLLSSGCVLPVRRTVNSNGFESEIENTSESEHDSSSENSNESSVNSILESSEESKSDSSVSSNPESSVSSMPESSVTSSPESSVISKPESSVISSPENSASSKPESSSSDRSEPTNSVPQTPSTPQYKEYTFVLNKSTKKYHEVTCREIKKINAENRQDITIKATSHKEAEAQVESMGYVKCKRCY